jgi:drug/metabolite transporter (DMT)-like permease
MLLKRSPRFAEDDNRVSLGLTAASAVAAPLLVFLACVLGTSSLAEDFEGVRPMFALLAALILGVAGLMISAMARALTPLPRSPRGALWMLAIAGLLAAVYVFVAALPGSPAFHDSWGELIAATLGLWIGLAALCLLDERLMWRFVAGASMALVGASVAVSAL